MGKPSVERSLHCKLGMEAQTKVIKNAIKQISEMTNIFSNESQLLKTMFQHLLCIIIFLQDILEVLIKI